MRRLILILALLAVLPQLTQAQVTTNNVTDAIANFVTTISPDEGIMFGVREHQVKSITSFKIVGYASTKYDWIRLNFNALYAPANLIGGSFTYPLGSFSSITGINVATPVLSWFAKANISIGYGGGWFTSGGNRRTDDGPLITGNIKF